MRITAARFSRLCGGIFYYWCPPQSSACARALEGVASDIKFTSAATHDSFILAPENFERGDLPALDRAYIDYGKFEDLTKRGIVYVTKMKSGLSYKVVSDVMQNSSILMQI